MAEPFLGEIRIFSFNFPPKGWALCNGQFLPINQNQALFSLFGTMYGGNGQTTFALPNLRGQVPIHVGAGFIQGQAGGTESVTITQTQMPQHLHVLMAVNTDGTSAVPGPTMMLANSKNYEQYRPATNLTTMTPGSVTSIGGSQAHINMQPYLVLNFCVALQGIFPSRN